MAIRGEKEERIYQTDEAERWDRREPGSWKALTRISRVFVRVEEEEEEVGPRVVRGLRQVQDRKEATARGLRLLDGSWIFFCFTVIRIIVK